MKISVSKLLFGKDAKLTLAIALAALAFVALACGGSGSKSTNKPLPSTFHGSWATKDGSSLRLTSDGLGYYKAGGTTVDGAAAELDETGKILKLSFLGVAIKEFKIEQEPKGGQMKLDGVIYQTADFKGGSDTDTSDDSGDKKTASKEVPSESDMADMVEEIILAANTAVQDEDFDAFKEKYGSKPFNTQVSSEKLTTEFSEFIKDKSVFNDVLTSVEGLSPAYTKKPEVADQSGYKVLSAGGKYQTKPPTVFDLQWVWEEGAWKLLKIRINVSKTN